MPHYLDTSVLVPLFFREPGTALAQGEVALASDRWISHWTLAEFASATAFKLRSGQTDATTAARAGELFQQFAASMLTVVDVLREDFAEAARLCETTPAPGLRTPDALPLALARRLGLVMVTLDNALAVACALHNVPCRHASDA